MSYKFADLQGLSRDQLIAEHDEIARNTFVGINYYLEELARRDAMAVAERAEQATADVRKLTWVITVLTSVNMVAAVVAAVAAIAN